MVFTGVTPKATKAFFSAVLSWSLVGTRTYPMSSPAMVLNVPFTLPGLFCGRVLRESGGCENAPIFDPVNFSGACTAGGPSYGTLAAC